MAQLFVLSGADVGRSFEVRGGDTIGRSQDCILVFKDTSISRHHAHLEEAEGHWCVVDDGSRNGIVTGGVKTRRADLSDGQEFLLGEVLLRFRADPTPAAAQHEPEVEIEVSAERSRPPAPAPAPPLAPPPPRGPRRLRPVPPPPARAPQPAAADEIVLEGAEEIELAPARSAAPARGPERAGLAEQRERVLQYHRVTDTGSGLSVELGQLPVWKRWSIYLLALVLLAAVAAAAFFGAAFLRDRMTAGQTATQEAPR